MKSFWACLGSVAAVMLWARVASAAPTVATTAHPRIVLTPQVRARLATLGATAGNPVYQSVKRCADIRARPGEFARAGYQGLDWATYLQACLIAWAATDADADASTAIKYFTAMLDDRDAIGDGTGGDDVVSQDSGFAIRAFGPYTAIAYDWLHDHKLMNADLLATARSRFHAWTTWYAKSGYRARGVGTNYHAGYVMAATLMAVAEAGEGGDKGDALWNTVTTTIWGQDMASGLAVGAILDGGDWGEGWQYGPLAVAHYAFAGRVLADAGVAVPRMREFVDALLTRHVHALSPSGGVFVGGDTESETAGLVPNPNVLAAVAIGDASPLVRGQAIAEMSRLGMIGPKAEFPPFPLLISLAVAREDAATPIARASLPTWFLAQGTGNLYARANFSDTSVWTVMQCTSSLDIDHFHADAGNVVLSRGADDVIIDPSPYGTLSTLTSNAPTVASAHLPANYIPGQAYWSEQTRWVFAHQSQRGVVAARCDYADQYRFQERPTDVPKAMRDLVLIPWSDGKDATLVLLDRARSGSAARPLYTRLRTTGSLVVAGDVARADVGASSLAVQRLASSTGTLAVGKPPVGDCFGEGVARGSCEASRFPTTEVKLTVAGPVMSAVQVVDVAAKNSKVALATLRTGTNWKGAWMARAGSGAMVVWSETPDAKEPIVYTAPAVAGAVHVVLDPPGNAELVSVAAERVGEDCKVTVAAGGDVPARPVHLSLDDKCAIVQDNVMVSGSGATESASPAPATSGQTSGIDPKGVDQGTIRRPAPTSPRSGCCGAQAGPTASLPMVGLVLLMLFRRRQRRFR